MGGVIGNRGTAIAHGVTGRGSGAVLAILLALGPVAGCERAPVGLSQVTWQSLQNSRRQGAEAAPEIWGEALARYDSAWLLIEAQNRLLFFERDFDVAESLLVRSEKSGRSAVLAAMQNRDQQALQIDSTITDIGERIRAHRLAINGHIARIPLRKTLTAAELGLAALREARDRGSLDEAWVARGEAEKALQEFEDRLSHDWADPTEVPGWNRMVRETVKWSRQNGSTALVVVKMDRRAYLLKGGKIIEDYPVEFGYRAWAQKMRSGDGATPEGTYHVTRWRDRDTRYYKALNLSYPNDQDLERFDKNKKAGKIPRSSRIGGMIEIHGQGGKGEDWTEGCVALSNKDMDRLMARMNVGDRVTIVREVSGWPD